ncbi:MAG: hypothetical protein HY898_32320 [Deltaproteobacteria bacterium]|nr:hypothetical protein [Deltaproteobacteria bacterium]
MGARIRRRGREVGFHDPAAWVLLIAVVLLAQVALWYARLYHYNVIDDAYISFNYSKNLMLGRGIVFNPGEYVEGYTNFLWIIALTPVFMVARALHADLTTAAILFNLVIALLDLCLVYWIARRMMRRSWVPVGLAIVLCVLDNSYQGYAVSGLENHLVLLCMLGALLFALGTSPRRWLWTGILLGLANLSRPDAGLFGATFALAFALDLVRKRGDDGSSRVTRAALLGKTVAIWLLITGVWFLWRWRYYGLLLPNTFYLKVASTFDGVQRGLEYSRTFLEDRYYLPVAALLALRWVHQPIVRWLLLFVLFHMAWITYVGGDFYTGHRFFIVLLPMLYLLIARTFDGVIAMVSSHRWWKPMRRNPILVASLIGALGGASGYGLAHFTNRLMERGPYTGEYLRWSDVVDGNVRYMRWLARFVRPGSSMVVGDIGAAGFFADLSVIDALGVVDPNTSRMKVSGFGKGKPGHEKWAPREYMLSKKPTYVKWGWISGDLTGNGYYLFTDFPQGIDPDGLWIKEDLVDGRFLPETAIHFDPSEVAFWTPSGSAFATFPTQGIIHGQLGVFGHAGSYVNTFTANEGDKATGRLLSPPFALVGDKMIVRVGGGRDPDKLRVSLLIDGKRVFYATGSNRENLGRRVWDIAPYKGKQARMEVVDIATGSWGHIMVDEAVQWVSNGRK